MVRNQILDVPKYNFLLGLSENYNYKNFQIAKIFFNILFTFLPYEIKRNSNMHVFIFLFNVKPSTLCFLKLDIKQKIIKFMFVYAHLHNTLIFNELKQRKIFFIY